jgi:hypothetical protein
VTDVTVITPAVPVIRATEPNSCKNVTRKELPGLAAQGTTAPPSKLTETAPTLPTKPRDKIHHIRWGPGIPTVFPYDSKAVRAAAMVLAVADVALNAVVVKRPAVSVNVPAVATHVTRCTA